MLPSNRSRRSLRQISFLLGSLVGSMALASLTRAGTNAKVEICHFPPGKPANFQTITVGAAALPAHLAHGDFPGPCANDCQLFGSVCDDGNACTTDSCNLSNGDCVHSAVDCNDGIPNTADSCSPTNGCEHILHTCPTDGDPTACQHYVADPLCFACVLDVNDQCFFAAESPFFCSFNGLSAGCAANANGTGCAAVCCP